MSEINIREIGGKSNKQGNRFEDNFAAYKLILLASDHFTKGETGRIMEQAGCPVDDIVVQQSKSWQYHQLKSGEQITWGQKKGKLKKEFLAQKAQCKANKETFTLTVVVADPKRLSSLQAEMPKALKAVCNIFLFPILARPSELVRQKALIGTALEAISALRRRDTHDEDLILSFYLAWMDHQPDSDGYCVLDDVLAQIRKWKLGHLRKDYAPNSQVTNAFNSVPGLRWWVDRGVFEWEYPPTDWAVFPHPCDSEPFRQFIERLLKTPPDSFAQFERLLNP